MHAGSVTLDKKDQPQCLEVVEAVCAGFGHDKRAWVSSLKHPGTGECLADLLIRWEAPVCLKR